MNDTVIDKRPQIYVPDMYTSGMLGVLNPPFHCKWLKQDFLTRD